MYLTVDEWKECCTDRDTELIPLFCRVDDRICQERGLSGKILATCAFILGQLSDPTTIEHGRILQGVLNELGGKLRGKVSKRKRTVGG